MARELVISNGEVFIGFDKNYVLRDLYFRHVGQENHTKGNPQRFGINVARGDRHVNFAWSDSDQFGRTLGYNEDSLVAKTTLIDDYHRGIMVECNDAIHRRHSMYLKKMTVTNRWDEPCYVQLFFQTNPWLKGSHIANTVQYWPDLKALAAYKEDVYMLSNALVDDSVGFHSYACGDKNEDGTRGCFMDAQTDARLEQGTVAQGSVDSVGSIGFHLDAKASKTVWYWVCFGKDEAEVRTLNGRVTHARDKGRLLSGFLESTDKYWREWVNKQLRKRKQFDACPLNTCKRSEHDHSTITLGDLPDEAKRLLKRSLLIARAHSDVDGGIIASADGDMVQHVNDSYCYTWPRDAAFIIMAFDLLGYGEESRKALKFFQHVLTTKTIQLYGQDEDSLIIGYLAHKFNPDKTMASSWHTRLDKTTGQELLPIQEDETALVLVSMWKHYDVHSNSPFFFEGEDQVYDNFVVPAANFLAWYREPYTGLPAASVDLWEERRGIHAFTVATVYAGLLAAANLGDVVGDPQAEHWRKAAEEIKAAFEKHMYSEHLQRFVRTVNVDTNGQVIYDQVVDASMSAIWYFGMLSVFDERVERSQQSIETQLRVKTHVDGIARYEHDNYHRQGEYWDDPRVPGNPWPILELWQSEWYTQRAKTREDLAKAKDWIDRVVKRASRSGLIAEQYHPITGEQLSVSPLTWSHGGFVPATLAYAAKYKQLEVAAAEKGA